MHPEVCNGLGLPNLTGRHLGSARVKCRTIDLTQHKVINKKTLVDHDGHPRSQKGENSSMICWSLIDPAYGGEMNVTEQPFESTVGLVCRGHLFPYFLLWYAEPH